MVKVNLRAFRWRRDRAEGYRTCKVTGKRHWGVHGAAGILPYVITRDGRMWVAMSLRSPWVQDGSTWAGFGGAIDGRESAWQAARRETSEEVEGLRFGRGTIAAKFRDFCPHGCGWSYTTYVVECLPAKGGRLPGLRVRKGHSAWETSQLAWVPAGQVANRRLHPGYAATIDRNLAAVR
jgi:8-oxo-dGTP diphosphatase